MITVIITRPKPAIAVSEQTYKNAGFEVLKAPCFDVVTNTSVKPEWLKAAADVWVVLSVHALYHARKLAADLHPPANTRVIGVGPAVVAAWQQHYQHPIETHASMDSAGVLALLEMIKPNSVNILTTANGRDMIKKYCMKQCIGFNQVNTYQRLPLSIDVAAVVQHCKASKEKPVVLTATSGSILTHFMAAFDASQLQTLLPTPLVVGARRIATLAKELGFEVVTVADNPSDEAMSAAVAALDFCRNSDSGVYS